MEKQTPKPLSFAEDMMDSLDEIKANLRRGSNVAIGISTFCRSYKKNVETFLSGMYKSVRAFETDILREKGISTTALGIASLTSKFDELVREVSAELSYMNEDLIEPLESFGKSHLMQSTMLFSMASSFWDALHIERSTHAGTKERYFQICSAVERSELDLLRLREDQGKGLVSTDELHRQMQNTADLKF